MNKLFRYYFGVVFLFLVLSHLAWMIPQSSVFYRCDYYWVEDDDALSKILKNLESNQSKRIDTADVSLQDLYWQTRDFFENNEFYPQKEVKIKSIRINDYSYNVWLCSDNRKVFVSLGSYEKDGTWYPFAIKNNIVGSIKASSIFAEHAFSGIPNVKHNIWRLLYTYYGALFFERQIVVYVFIFLIGWFFKKCIEE